MNDGTQENPAAKKRGRPRKTPQTGTEAGKMDVVFRDSGKNPRVHGGGDIRSSELPELVKGSLENTAEGLSKMRVALQYLQKLKGQLCLVCAITLFLIATDIVPRTILALDRESPYTISEFKMGAGYPGQMVPLTAIIEETTQGRICGVVANPQIIDATGELGYVSTTRLISGDAVQTLRKRPDGKIFFKTSVQVPINLNPGDGDLIVDIAMICRDNETHSERPILSVVKGKVKVLEKPEHAPQLPCNRSGK